MSLSALLSIGLILCASSSIRGRKVVLVFDSEDGATRRLLDQGDFARRFCA